MTVVNRQYYIIDGKLISYHGKDKKVEIPLEVNDIGPRAFYGSIATEAVIAGNVSNVEGFAFAETKIKKLFILDGVKSLEADAFANCQALEEVYLLSSSLLPLSTASMVFRGCTSINTLYVDKISTKLFMFLDSEAFLNLRDIYVGSDNTTSFIEKLKEKFPKATVHVKGIYDENVSSLTSSLIKQIEALFGMLPDDFRDRLCDAFRIKYAQVNEEELLNNSSVVTEKLQRIIMNFDETKKFIPFMELINKAKRTLDKELFVVPMVSDDVISKISYIHYMAMKFNDLGLSKNVDAILESVQERISNYILDGDNVSTLEVINILSGYLNGKIDRMYEQVRSKYNNPIIGKYVDLLDEFREEKKSGLFYYFNSFLQENVNNNLDNKDKLSSYNRSYQRMISYERFITDEISKVLNGANTRYPSYEEMESDLIKDFRNRDNNFTSFYKQYKDNEKVRPYMIILHSLSFVDNRNNESNFNYEVDINLVNSLEMVRSLISSLKDSERVFYQNELRQVVSSYIDKLTKRIEEVSKSNESNQKYLYNLQVEAMEIRNQFDNNLAKLVDDIHEDVLKPQDTMLVDKSIDISLAILDSTKDVKAGNSKIALLVSKIVEELVLVDEETSKTILAKLKDSLLMASVEVRENKEKIVKGREGSTNKILEDYVYNIVNDYYQFVLKYRSKYIDLQNFRNDFEMKKAC